MHNTAKVMSLLTTVLLAAFSISAQEASSPANPAGLPDMPTLPSVQGSTPETPPKFSDLDRNRDGFIESGEISPSDKDKYSSLLSEGDTTGDKKISELEFTNFYTASTLGSTSTYAGLLLVLAFASFCLFVDGFLEPERRDYFWIVILASIVFVGLGYVIEADWFLTGQPYLVWLGAIPAVFICLALVTGNTKEVERETVKSEAQKVYVVGGGGTSSARPVGATSEKKRPAAKSAPKRGSLAPGRTARRQAPRSTSPPPQKKPGQRRRPPRPPESGGGSPPPRRPPKKDS